MSNYTDEMTLDEISDNDLAMVKDAIKNANKYSFGKNKQQAMAFFKHCMDITLKRCEITVNPPKGTYARELYEKVLDKQMAEGGILIEHRNKYRANDMWRNGLYVFKNGELVAFISNVLLDVKESYSKETFKLSKRSIGYFVITNAKTDQTQRIYTPPGTILH